MKFMEHSPQEISEDLVHEVEDAIDLRGGDLTKEEVGTYIQKLDTAIAIANDEGARRLREYLLSRFR